MGYQESFIHTTCSNVERNNSDIARYIEMFKKYDVRCEGDWLASCVCKLHFNKTVSKYKKGMDVLVIAGERQAQRWSGRLFDCDSEYEEKDMRPQYTDEELKLIGRAKITFIEEEWGVLEAEKDESLITVEKLNLLPNLPDNYEEVSGIVENIFNKLSTYVKSIGLNIKDIRYYNPRNKKDVDVMIDIFKSEIEGAGYSFECRKEEETIHNGSIRYDYKFYINNVYLGECSYLTWSDKYSFIPYNMFGQELRNICKDLLAQKEAI